MRASSLTHPLVVVLLCAAGANAQHKNHAPAASSVPVAYPAITSRTVYPEPTLPATGAAGQRFTDPTFGSRLLRVTDANTRPGSAGSSYSGPSAAHQLAWSAASDRFYIRSVDGFFIPYNFDAVTMTASRISPISTGNGGLVVSSQVEPQFSFLTSSHIYGTRQDSVNDWPIVRRFDFDTLTYTDILNLSTLTTILPTTYTGALSSSATSPEKLMAMFGGIQDTHYKVAVFQVSPAGANPAVLDTQTSTITRNGTTAGTNITLNFLLHHAWLDQSGRYVLLYPVNAVPVPYYVWDLSTDIITAVTTRGEGHDATGFGRQVNQSCCTTTTYDGAQWQSRALATPATTTDLISPVMTPQEVYIANHTSWNNAESGTLTPILSSLYRYYDGTLNTTPWRAWDDEIVAIQTNASGGATVWRFAHHRSNVSPDAGGSGATYFWYLPRAVISPNGRWALFTSNWEKTLGNTVGSDIEPGGLFRNDVFVLALTKSGLSPFTDDPLEIGGTAIRAVHMTELRSRIDALRVRFTLGAVSWTDPSLAGVTAKAAHLTELRTALQQAYVAAGLPAPTFTDATVTAGSTRIRAVHIQELRDAVVDLEVR